MPWARRDAWQKDQRVGVGWHGGHCFVCEQCRRGDFAMCVNRKVTGIDFGRWLCYARDRAAAVLAAIPDDLPAEEAGPIHVCGRNRLQRAAKFGSSRREVVAVHGIGDSGISVFSTRAEWDSNTVAIQPG